MKKKIIVIFFLTLLVGMSYSAYPWVGDTHETITEQVEKQNNILQSYLVNIGFPDGRVTEFTLQSSGYYLPPDFEARFLLFSPVKRTYSALDWLVKGSVKEDSPITRARHHFHDPTTLDGLRNRPFMWGESARDRAFEDPDMEFRWSDGAENLRHYFFKALTSPTEDERSHYWALTLFGLGSVLHLLEDMSVPEHVRNDFTYGHAIMGYSGYGHARNLWNRKYKYTYIESYMKAYLEGPDNSGESVCGLSGMIGDQSIDRKKPQDLWDPNTEAPGNNKKSSFGSGGWIEWGLSQVTNYYFLARVDQITRRSRFPNPISDPDPGIIQKPKLKPEAPVLGHTPERLFICRNGPDGVQYAVAESTHTFLLTPLLIGERKVFSSFLAGLSDLTYTPEGFYLSTEVFRDYARILVPMMKGYAHRLMMLFLGLNFEIIELRITEPSSGNYQAEIEIKNKSDVTILSGALFNTYYDDPETGERHPLFTTENGEGEELDYIIIDQDIEPDSTIFIQAPLSEKPATVCPLFSIPVIYDATLIHEDCVGDCQTNAVIKGEINLVATKLKLLKPDGTDFAKGSEYWLIVTSYPDGEDLCLFRPSGWNGCCYYDSPQDIIEIYSSEITRLEFYYDGTNCQGPGCPGSRNCGYFEDSSGNELIQPQVGGDPINMYGPPESPTPELFCDCIYYTP